MRKSNACDGGRQTEDEGRLTKDESFHNIKRAATVAFRRSSSVVGLFEDEEEDEDEDDLIPERRAGRL